MRAADLRAHFGPTYLTITSVLQAVLLGLLATLIDVKYETMDAENWLQVTSSVIVIVLVWNEYRMGVSQFVWIPNIIDSLIPFAVGAVQLVLLRTSFLSVDLWLAALAGFYWSGLLAYENMYRRAAWEGTLNTDVLLALGSWRYINPALCVGCGLLFGACAALTRLANTSRGQRLAILVVVLAINVAFLLRGELNWRRVVRLAHTSG